MDLFWKYLLSSYSKDKNAMVIKTPVSWHQKDNTLLGEAEDNKQIN